MEKSDRRPIDKQPSNIIPGQRLLGTKRKRARSSSSRSNGRTVVYDRFVPRINPNAIFKTAASSSSTAPLYTQQRYEAALLTAMNLTRGPVLLYGARQSNKRQRFPHTLQHWPFEPSTPPSVLETVPKLPDSPERILDAPELYNDFYPHALDYLNGHMAICLGGIPHTWNKFNAEAIHHSLPDGYVATCVKLSKYASDLFVGCGHGDSTSLACYDLCTNTLARTIDDIPHQKPTCITQGEGNQAYVSSFSDPGHVSILDFSARNANIGRFEAHDQGVVTVSANLSGTTTYLATGSSAGEARIWDARNFGRPVITISHSAAVKGIAWHPRSATCIATGGATACSKIIITNTTTSERLVEYDTGAQISGLSWNKDGEYLISTHGFPHNGIQVFRYKPGQGLTNIHNQSDPWQGRILCHVYDKAEGELATLSGDETVKIWDYSALTPAPIAPIDEAPRRGSLSSHTIR